MNRAIDDNETHLRPSTLIYAAIYRIIQKHRNAMLFGLLVNLPLPSPGGTGYREANPVHE